MVHVRHAGTHTVQFYDDDAFFLDTTTRLIGATLGGGDAVVVFATAPHQAGIAARLDAHGFDLARAARQGRYIALDAEETLAKILVDGWPDEQRFRQLVGDVLQLAMAGQERHVEVVGEMVVLLAREGRHDAAIELERCWNELIATHGITLHCAYPMKVFGHPSDGEAFAHICAAHSGVVPQESYTALGSEDERLRMVAFLQQKAQTLEQEIAGRKHADLALVERNRELHQAIIARDEFLAMAAHELRTPVAGLRGYAQLLRRNSQLGRPIAQERLSRTIAAFEQQTEKLHRLVARLLDTNQIEAGKLRLEPVTVDVVPLIRACLAEHPTDAEHPLVFRGPERLEAMVDPARFEQVLTNLLDNAIRYSPSGGSVAVGLEQSADGALRLSVTDKGPGIPREQREIVFARFHQGHRASHLSGLGLGLFITREIVELHGGAVWIEDPEDSELPGARFVISLPATPSEPVA